MSVFGEFEKALMKKIDSSLRIQGRRTRKYGSEMESIPARDSEVGQPGCHVYFLRI